MSNIITKIKNYSKKREEIENEKEPNKRMLIKKEKNKTHNVINKIKKHFRKKDLVETVITIRTKYLAKEVKNLCDFNIKVTLLALLGALLTSLTTLSEKGNAIVVFFSSNSNIQNLPYSELILCGISILMILLSLYSFIKEFKMYNPRDFVNHIIEEQYDTEEHTAIFIIKAMFDNVPKILVFRSETWKSYFLPYCHYDPNLSDEKNKEKVKTLIAEQLEVNVSDFEIYDDFTQNNYVAIKKNPSHKSMSKINYRFYYIKFINPYVGRKYLNSNLQYFSWKSKYELGKDMNTQLNNGDIVSIIDELSLINQSKLAFKERNLSSYEISSNYSIIWNITNECFFNCPICATCSGTEETCKLTYQDKLNILLNLASINGNILSLDISGGDPLKNEDDRRLIKKAHQILAFTDIKVTTTGKALESISINETLETIKKCDITYDIPYEICSKDLQKYREYNYNYYNYRQLEKFSNSGVKIELNIHIPILPATIDEELISMILDDLNKINPTEVKFIRLMPVGRMESKNINEQYSPEKFINLVSKYMKEKDYKFSIKYNCSLGTRIMDRENEQNTVKKCGMLERKLGIDCNGRVYACIWGAYISEYQGENYKENPFYLGNLQERTMYEILTDPVTIKLAKSLEKKAEGCRVCAFVKARTENETATEINNAQKIMIESKDSMAKFIEPIFETVSKSV